VTWPGRRGCRDRECGAIASVVHALIGRFEGLTGTAGFRGFDHLAA